jgi:hypothetical protein
VRFCSRLALCATALVSLNLAGCVRDPTVRFDHAELNGVQIVAFPPRLGVSLTVVADITNPNSFDIAIRAMRGQVLMSDRYPLPLNFQAPGDGLWLRAGQVTPVRLPVDMPVDLAIELIRESFASPYISFHVVGAADVTGTSSLQVHKNNFPLDLRGVVTRQQVQGVVPTAFLPR